MRSYQAIIVTLFTLLVIGCATSGGTYLSDGQTTVTFGPKVLEAERLEVLQDYEVIETLLRYVSHRFKKLKVRKSLKLDITINSMRLKASTFSAGRSFMSINVVVKENGNELKQFSSTITTGERKTSAVKKMSKALAKRIYEEIKDL